MCCALLYLVVHTCTVLLRIRHIHMVFICRIYGTAYLQVNIHNIEMAILYIAADGKMLSY